MNESTPNNNWYDIIYNNDNPNTPSGGWIQWKGTDICIDLHCVCGCRGHIDGMFMYSVECAECGRRYAVGQNIKLIELDTPELLESNEKYHRDYGIFGKE